MVFLWFSYGFPMVFLWFSYGFPMGVAPKIKGSPSHFRLRSWWATLWAPVWWLIRWGAEKTGRFLVPTAGCDKDGNMEHF